MSIYLEYSVTGSHLVIIALSYDQKGYQEFLEAKHVRKFLFEQNGFCAEQNLITHADFSPESSPKYPNFFVKRKHAIGN